ncbi:unnamed protein product [Cladocopium goreaui]|uniref:phosphoribosylanthranilate isomerase n=1 Tax=Cladocopium goreaui TaxID=2562237 RepID=A0A9P1BG46_9DINO|nr:unnamed protein product [Cladocopium goreaui]
MDQRKTAFLFDLDGTLIDSVYQHVLAWQQALQESGIPLSVWRIHRKIGMSGGLFTNMLLRETECEITPELLDTLSRAHATAYNRLSAGIDPLPGARELLAYLDRSDTPWTIATSGRMETARRTLENLGIDFERTPVVTRDQVNFAKPDPDLFLTAAERLGVPIESAVVVGDSIWDILAARRARALSVGLLSGGYGREELIQAGALRVYEDPADLLKHIDEICCIASLKEARLAIDCGADAIGLVADMPSGPGTIADELIAQIAVAVPPPVATCLLTCETTASSIVRHIHKTQVNTVQIVDDEVHPDIYGAIREAVPLAKIVQVVHVRGKESIEKAVRASEHVDSLLLDSGNPGATIRELGGTGRTHDWEISRQIVERASRPIFLAGGINPDNVEAAITAVRPYGIDVCSGVRQDGRLNRERLTRLVAAMERARKASGRE